MLVTCRRERYRALREACERHDLNALAVAHHASDQVCIVSFVLSRFFEISFNVMTGRNTVDASVERHRTARYGVYATCDLWRLAARLDAVVATFY